MSAATSEVAETTLEPMMIAGIIFKGNPNDYVTDIQIPVAG